MSPRLISPRFPYLPIQLTVSTRGHVLEALIDTGFDDHVVVPRELVPSDLPPDGHNSWTLADGSDVLAPYYIGSLTLRDLGTMSVLVSTVGDEPLVGRRVTDLFSVTLDHGREVIVEP